ncbi:MAG: S41 family peptidase [Planctomycetota bacterium]
MKQETYGQQNDDIIQQRLKGPQGTKVKVTIFRPGLREERDYEIERALITVPSVNDDVLPGQIGYVEIIQFAQDTAQQLDETLARLEQQGIKGLILDVRNNTGGYLETAVDVVGHFVGPGQLVVYTEGRSETEKKWVTRRVTRHGDYPIVMLVNGRSASASEILAGAMQFYGKAKLVGERTFGKGSVQNPLQLQTRLPEPFVDTNKDGRWDPGEPFTDRNKNGKWDPGSLIKLTTARYFLPNHQSIHTERDENGRVIQGMEGGIKPDITVKWEGIKPWKEEELADLIEKDVFKSYVDKHFAGNEQLFMKLAENDDYDPSRYPEFDAWYDSLGTHLSKEDIRQWVRTFSRDKVSDLRKKVFPGVRFLGDFEQDNQLQAGLVTLCGMMNVDPASIAEYHAFANRKFGEVAQDGEAKDSKESKAK